MASSAVASHAPAVSSPRRIPPWASLGVLFGVTSALSVLAFGPIGVSGTYPRAVGAVARAVAPDWAAGAPYLVKMGSVVTPESLLVVGLLLGGFLARRLSRSAPPPAVEIVHAAEHRTGTRYLTAFAGGFLILFGARLAGGCTSGHIISGISQLAASSFIFAAAVFGAGMLTAKLLRARA
ncbi:MAG: YeeE/YedE thiosulfate transporter family protein [Gemmatimonadaceae bacterium]|nr:YeeE/YedE thiosulfate transporter family protein [Gemmatimonadaceae bacterium]